MQPCGIHTGMSAKSQLYDFLKVYLNNKNRLQPIIGLNSVAECVKAGSHSKETLYLCEVCVCRLSKPDIRNHIMGSLHRYNYIRARHPRYVAEWKEDADLSKRAWPLMEMAQLLEKREGPGDVQVLELDAVVYKKLESYREPNAIALLNTIRWEWAQTETGSQSEDTSSQLEHSIVQSNRVVLQAQKEPSQSEKPRVKAPKNITQLPKATAQASKCLPVLQSTAAPSVRVKAQSKTVSLQSQPKTCQKSHDPFIQSENSHCVLDDYTGSRALIVGLDYVVECRSEEEGHTYCFLCHCCQTKTTPYDVLDHLTSSSHSFNYIMGVYPERVEVSLAGLKGNIELFQSVVQNVEKREGRGQRKVPHSLKYIGSPAVIRLPASLCNLLTENGYHWCKQMLSDGNWASTDTQKRKNVAKGPSVVGTSGEGMAEKHTPELSKLAKRAKNTMMTKRRKIENVTNPVFKVSLPLSKGAMLLERTSFSLDKIPASTTPSPAASPARSPSPEPLTPELDCGDLAVYEDEDRRSIYWTVCSGETQRRVEVWHRGQGRSVVQHPEEQVHFTDGQSFNWGEDPSGTNQFEQEPPHDQHPTFESDEAQKYDPFLYEKQGAWASNDLDDEKRYVYEERNWGNRSNAQSVLTAGRMYDEPPGVMGEHPNAPQIQKWAIHNTYHREEQSNSEVEQQVISHLQNEEGAGERSSHASSQVYYQHQLYTSLPAHTSGHHGMQSSAGFPPPAPHDYVTPAMFHPVQVGHEMTAGPYYNKRLEPQPNLPCFPPDIHAPVPGSQSRMFMPSGPAQGYANQPYQYSSSDWIGLSGQIMPGGADGRSSPYMVNYTSRRFPASHWEQIPHQSNADGVGVLDTFGSNHTQIRHQFL